MIRFLLNEKTIETDLPPGMVLLDFIRYQQHFTGTKIGCREGDCGACTVLVGAWEEGEFRYRSMTSCLLPLGNAEGKHILTVEGINFPGKLNPIQEAMNEEGATQCGFCTPGFIMSLSGYCLEPDDAGPIAAIDGNICRCTGYKSIERAAKKIEGWIKEGREDLLPEYIRGIPSKLKESSTPALFPKTNALVLGGGTDLYVQKHEEMVHADIDFLFDKKGRREIRKEGDELVIGGGATVSDLRESKDFNNAFPAFFGFSKLISSTPIRNMATLAGNFVNASPIGDLSVLFLALNAVLILEKGGQQRSLLLKEFFKGYKQLNKEKEEQVLAVRIKIPSPAHHFNFEKVSKRTHLDIASVNTAFFTKLEEGRIKEVHLSAGGVAPIPLFLTKTSAFLSGKLIEAAVLNEAIRIMQTEIAPISDARGSKEYKSLLLAQLIKAHFIRLFPEKISSENLIAAG